MPNPKDISQLNMDLCKPGKWKSGDNMARFGLHVKFVAAHMYEGGRHSWGRGEETCARDSRDNYSSIRWFLSRAASKSKIDSTHRPCLAVFLRDPQVSFH